MVRMDARERQVERCIATLEGQGFERRADANETAIFSRQLEQIETRLFDVKYPEGHAVDIVPLLTSIDKGADQYTYRAFDYVGQAKRSSNYADDAPRVDISGFEVTAKLHSYRAAYGYSVQDMRAAAMANLPLDAKRASAVRNVLMRKLDQVLWLGDTEVNVHGLANSTLVDLVSVITGTWTSATALQMLADVQKLVSAATNGSSGVEKSDTLVLPVSRYQILTQTFIGNDLNKTVMDLLLKANPGLKVYQSYMLELADAEGDGPRAIAFTNDPEKLEGLVSVEFEQFAPIAKNMAFSIDCHMRCGGVAIRYPGSVKYMDVI